MPARGSVPVRPGARLQSGARLAAGCAAGVGLAVTLSGCTVPRISASGVARPDATILAAVGLSPQDAAPGAEYSLTDNGDQVAGQVSLDLCRADYPSEAHRQARHQVALNDGSQGDWVSTEALIYDSAASAESAMAELAAAAQSCHDPDAQQAVFLPGAAYDQGLTWRFEPAPDADWPTTAGVARQAYAFEISDAVGESYSYVTTYLRRGRVLVAVYVTPPGASSQVIVHEPSQQKLVEVISARIAALPAADAA